MEKVRIALEQATTVVEAGGRSLVVASVFAGGRHIPYLRGGSGPRVVLLAPTLGARPLARALVARFRVMAPRLPRPDSPGPGGYVAPDGLADFLEGVGAGPVSFVSTPQNLARAHRFATFDREHVLGVAALPGGGRSADPGARALAGLRELGVPVLVLEGESLPPGRGKGPELDRLVSFLEAAHLG